MHQALVYSLHWKLAQKLAFRFFFVYFLLYVFPVTIWNGIVPWVGRVVLTLPYEITIFPNGSGDTTFNYVQVFCFVVLATGAALVWSVVDRSRPNYNTLLYWLVVLLRYYLGFIMISYGFAKVFKTQFPFPDLMRLLQPYGQSSPMGLAWTFMGYSTAYNWFTGLSEVIGGGLLLFRRTTALGSVILIGVIGNIVAINFCFDIPVKLFSLNLLLMTAFVLAAEGKRLINVLLLNRPAPALDLTPFPTSRRWRIGRIVVKTLLIGMVFYQCAMDSFQTEKQWGDKVPKPPLYGVYEVETFALNGDTLAPLLTDATRWRQVIVDGRLGSSTLLIRMMDESLQSYIFEPDTANFQALLYVRSDTAHKYKLIYQRPNTSSIVVRGVIRHDSIYVRLKQEGAEQFVLVNRGFHWINEYPFNR